MRKLLKIMALPTIAAVIALVAASMMNSTTGTTSVEAGPPQTVISLDVDPAPGVQNSTAPLGVGAVVNVVATLESIGGNVALGGYTGYQVKIYYDDVVLDADGARLPASWGTTGTPNTTSGNLAVFPNGPDCVPTTGPNARQEGADIPTPVEDDTANNDSINMGCLDNAVAAQTTIQDLVLFVVECTAPGVTNITLADLNDGQGGTYVLDDAFTPTVDVHNNASIDCNEPPTPTATNTPLPTDTPTNTATPTDTATATPTNTPVPGTRIEKLPEGNANNVDLDDPNLPLANLFLCEEGPCAGPNEGSLSFSEMAFLSSPNDRLGGFEFQIKFDHKIFPPQDIEIVLSSTLNSNPAPLGVDNDGRVWDATQCFKNVTENYINFACVSTGPVNSGYAGPQQIPVAVVTLNPDPDLKFRIRPGNDNGVVRVVLDENCELANTLGHPLEGAVGGGLTPVCGDMAVTVRILEGDLNLDCDVDTNDAQKIAQRYGMTFGLFLYDPWYDLEPNITDFDIDVKDLQKVFGRQGSNCQTPVPPQPPVEPGQNDPEP